MNSVFGRSGDAGLQAQALRGNSAPGGFTGRGGGNVIRPTRPPRPGELTLVDQLLLGAAGADPSKGGFTYIRGNEQINFPPGGGGVSRPQPGEGAREGGVGPNRPFAPQGLTPAGTPVYSGVQASQQAGALEGTKPVFNPGQLDPSKIRRRLG